MTASLDPAARFILNQILEIAKLCLEKSRSSQLTCSYFDEMIQSLEKLLVEAREKCSHSCMDVALEHLQRVIKRFLLVVSRVARLLECIEFDPLEFCFLLDFAEQQAKQEAIKIDIPKYIISKLGIDKFDPFEDFKTDEDECNVKERAGSYSRASSITGANSSSGISSTDVGDFGSEAGSTASSVATAAPPPPQPRPNELTPTEEDFQEIKLISNGAYGAVYLVRLKMSGERFAMKKIKKHNIILRNQLQQVFTERDIMTFSDNPFVVALVCTFETKKHLCMVMEYVEGGDVATLIKNMGPLPLDMARTYFAETTLAVEYLHNYGIIHRDLKPDNIYSSPH